MAVCYRKLWHVLLDKNIKSIELKEISVISDYSFRKLRNDQDVSTEVLTKVLNALGCGVQDIMDFLPNTITRDEALTNIGGSHHGR